MDSCLLHLAPPEPSTGLPNFLTSLFPHSISALTQGEEELVHEPRCCGTSSCPTSSTELEEIEFTAVSRSTEAETRGSMVQPEMLKEEGEQDGSDRTDGKRECQGGDRNRGTI